jgi:hypothetical protein
LDSSTLASAAKVSTDFCSGISQQSAQKKKGEPANKIASHDEVGKKSCDRVANRQHRLPTIALISTLLCHM